MMEYQVRSLVPLVKLEAEVTKYLPCASAEEPRKESSPWLYSPRPRRRRVSINPLEVLHGLSLGFPCHFGQQSYLLPVRVCQSGFRVDS